MIGQIVSHYRILEKLGEGGMGVVYKAEDTKLKRVVALKFLPPELTRDAEAKQRFLHEARAAAALNHVNIVTVHEINEYEDRTYIAMEFAEGQTLKTMIDEAAQSATPLPVETAITIAIQIAEGLSAAHEKGIVHRDLKPVNVHVTKNNIVKILDFGIAKQAGGQTKLTKTGTTVGTTAYMSPEQTMGRDVDQRSDIWSLGVILYEMVSGRVPFAGDYEQAVIYSILNEEPRPIDELKAGYPVELASIISKALTKDPAKRFPSARAMEDSLRDLKARLNGHGYRTAKRLTFGRGRKKLYLAFGALFLIIIASAVWIVTRPGLAFESRDKLMVADVENLTKDSVFDLALRTAIEASLQQSPYVAIFDRQRIMETLQLMRKDTASKVDEELGYEICSFGQVRAFILPRILSAGEAYEIQAILIDPLKRRYVDRIRVTARGREEVLLRGIDRLAEQVRSRLGESMSSIEKAKKSVTGVMTSSWDALNNYSLGKAKWEADNPKEAAAFMEMALEKDPQFAQAKIFLGTLKIYFLNQAEKGKDLLRQGLKDAENQNWPQANILACRALVKQYVEDDLTGALEEYRLMRELSPNAVEAYNNPGAILRSLGKYDEAVRMFEKAAQLDPRDSSPLRALWYTHLYFRKDPHAAENAARRWAILVPNIALPHSLLGGCLAAQEMLVEAEKELRKAIEIEPDHPYAVTYLAHVLFASGRAGEAVSFFRKIVDLVKQQKESGSVKIGGSVEGASLNLILAFKNSGDIESAKKIASEVRESVNKRMESARLKPESDDLCLLGEIEAMVGRPTEADHYLQQILAKEPKDPDTLMSVAQIDALLGRDKLAISTLKRALDAGYSHYFLPVTIPEFQSLRGHPEFRALFKLGKQSPHPRG